MVRGTHEIGRLMFLAAHKMAPSMERGVFPASRGRTAAASLFWKFLAIALVVNELNGGGIFRIRSTGIHQHQPLVESSCTKEAAVNNNTAKQQQKQLMIPHSTWCPHTSCGGNETTPTADTNESSASCTLCHARFLFILAPGRTASTTLTWTLNALPGLRMGGENNGVLSQLHDLMDNSVFYKWYQLGDGKRSIPFGHGNLASAALPHNSTMTDPMKILYCAAQDFVRGLYPLYSDQHGADKNDVIGFKSTNLPFLTRPAEEDVDFVRFMTTTFPCARFVINIRSDVQAHMASQLAADNKAEKKSNIEKDRQRLLAVAHQLTPERAYVLDSTEWTKNVTFLNGLVRWLGYSPECDFTEVLQLNTVNSYGNGKEELADAQERRLHCRYIGTDG